MTPTNLCAYLCDKYEATGQCGSFQYNTVTNKIELSPGLKKLLGFTGQEQIDTLYDFLDRIHPDDMGVFNHLLGSFAETSHTENEWQIIRPDNSQATIRLHVDRVHEDGLDWLIGIVWELPGSATAPKSPETIQQLTEELVDAGSWRYDKRTAELILSDGMYRLLQPGPELQMSPALYREYAIEEDQGIAERISYSIENGIVPFDETLRIRAGDQVKTIRVKAIATDEDKNMIVGVDVDITPIRAVEQDLKASLLSLKQKDNFIRIASHELKTPISSLRGYVQLLLRLKKPDDDFLQRSLEAVDRQVMNLNKLLDALLDIPDSEKGELRLKYERFNLYDLLEETVLFLQPSMKQPLLIRGDSEQWVMADKERINQVFVNLVSNATKYSPADKPVVVTITGDLKTVTVSVSDHGPGIADKEKEKIFDRFYRVNDERSQGIKGLGIGLYIAAEIVDQHKGKIWVENNEGTGAIFSFTVPKQRWSDSET